MKSKNKTCSAYEIQEENVHYPNNKSKEKELLKKILKDMPKPMCASAHKCYSLKNCKKKYKCVCEEARRHHCGEDAMYKSIRSYILYLINNQLDKK